MAEDSVELQTQIEVPELSLNTFDVKFLSDSPDGFSAITRSSLRRHEPGTPMPEAKRIAKVRATEKKDLRVGEHFYPKLGLRNIHKNGNELSFDIIPVTFPTYIAIRKPHESKDSLKISNPAATSMILLTTEENGTHKIVFQHRSAKNRLYGDIPGSSIAGYLDASLDKSHEGRGKINPIDTDYIKSNIIKEAEEEIGIKPGEIAELTITGIASDKQEIHDEFLLMGTTNLSSSELITRTGSGDYFKFSEKFFTMDATPENIETLLTKVKCPLPPTHAATFLAAGYSMVLKEKGIEEANRWKSKISEGINKNYKEIDEIVERYYQQNPQELDNIPAGKLPRNPNGYDAAYLPQEQGLPNAVSEFERTGLIIKEVEKSVEEAYVFDVDGVISDPGEKRPTIDGVLDAIALKLSKDEPVALNTGRSLNWMIERVIAPLLLKVENKKSLENFFAVGEKGGTWLTFNEEGRMEMHKDESISVPFEIQDKVKQLVEKRYSDTTFYDETKQTMVSTEMIDGLSGVDREQKYRPAQQKIVQELNEILRAQGLDNDFKVDPTTIATDIENKHVGKDFAIRRIIDWLKTRDISPKKFIAFGDSESDIPMAEELHRQGLPVEFVFVGTKNLNPKDFPFPVTTTNQHFEQGTLEYLNSR